MIKSKYLWLQKSKELHLMMWSAIFGQLCFHNNAEARDTIQNKKVNKSLKPKQVTRTTSTIVLIDTVFAHMVK